MRLLLPLLVALIAAPAFADPIVDRPDPYYRPWAQAR